MENITKTIFVESTSLKLLFEHLKILDGLPFENSYTFQPLDINFSYHPKEQYHQINIPIGLMTKFEYKYNCILLNQKVK
jgi:hypothetical protein